MSSHLETLKRVMNGDFAGATDEEKKKAVREVIEVCSVAAGAVTIQPMPLVDTVLITPIQIGMVQAIARIHGYKLDKKSILEILSTFGASIVAQNISMATAKLIPFLGWMVTMSVAFALTWAVGEVSDHYFRNGRTVPNDELKSMFDRVYKQKKAEKESSAKDDKLKEKLEQLKKAYESGILTDEEFARKKEEALKNF